MSLSLPSLPDRDDRLDALRGLAMVWMTVFHFSFDLQHYGFFRADFYGDPFWTWQRSGIVSLFLLCAGMGQAVALAQGQGWPRFWRRWRQVAGCALLVSVGSWFMFPRSFISFGVLHGMALMLLLLRWGLPRLGQAALLTLALVCVLLPALVQHPFFDTRWTNWLGLVTHKPVTEDYVPVLPWLGMMLLGAALARWLAPRLPPPRPGGPLRRGLALLGRWSLSYYMLHQPVLIGGLMLWQATMRA
ncbi:DUF1624 domain-containing protein [Roseateles sp. DB2]|uniref:DUF1624 domain-containing protein n=1 Tax=Roseateles sp. DB2 TaxID=3453717 RepID=UPI003EEFB2F0